MEADGVVGKRGWFIAAAASDALSFQNAVVATVILLLVRHGAFWRQHSCQHTTDTDVAFECFNGAIEMLWSKLCYCELIVVCKINVSACFIVWAVRCNESYGSTDWVVHCNNHLLQHLDMDHWMKANVCLTRVQWSDQSWWLGTHYSKSRVCCTNHCTLRNSITMCSSNIHVFAAFPGTCEHSSFVLVRHRPNSLTAFAVIAWFAILLTRTWRHELTVCEEAARHARLHRLRIVKAASSG